MQKTIVRIALILTVFIGLNLSAEAQKEKFIHYGGLNYVSNGEGLATLPLYNPRYVISELSDNASIGLTTYTSFFAAAQASYSSDAGSSTAAAFFLDLPIMVEYSLGRHANFEANNRFGVFVGAGPTFLYGAASYNGEGGSASTFGGTGYGGIRFKAFRQSMSIRGFYTMVFDKEAEPLFGASILYGLNRNDEIRGKGTSSSGGGKGYRYRRGNSYKHSWLRRLRDRKYFRHDRTGRRGNSFQY